MTVYVDPRRINGRVSALSTAVALIVFALSCVGCSTSTTDTLDATAVADTTHRDPGQDAQGSDATAADMGSDAAVIVTFPVALANLRAADLFIGTGGIGYGVGSALPGATTPFSLVKLSPDTATATGAMPAYSHCGGYAYSDTTIHAFSHTHMHGIGVPAYGNVAFMPVVGWKNARIKRAGRRTTYSHDNEHAEPGFYEVTLGAKAEGVHVELSAGMHVGYHRWQWPKNTGANDAVLVMDMSDANAQGEVLDGEVEILPAERRVRGYTRADGSQGGVVKVYFDATFNRDFRLAGGWKDGVLVASKKAGDPGQKFKIGGKHVGAWLAFELQSGGARTVEAAVGISYVDAAGARSNREGETKAPTIDATGKPLTGFDAGRERARKTWLDVFGQIKIEGGTASARRIFYGALYHVFQHPTQFSDRDGRYLGFDAKIHTDKRPFYSDLSLWDTYRTLHPLLILLRPKLSSDIAQSLVRMAQQWGGLPRWPLASEDAGSMIGTSADIVLAGSYLKGADDFDATTVWPYLWTHANETVNQAGRSDIKTYIAMGYIPFDVGSSSVSRTQEYAWDDFALANLATAMGDTKSAKVLAKRSRAFGGLWDPATRFFRGRNKDGSWPPNFDPEQWLPEYVEGNAWQHLWLTPQIDVLSGVMGGKPGVVDRLDVFFSKSKAQWESNAIGRIMPLPFYWHGNEPDIHAAWLYIDAGAAAKAQRWVRWIMEENYGLGAKGLPGNDDAGTLSAWYVFAALGIYPVAGSDRYWLGAPLFERITVNLPGGDLVIQTTGKAGAPYVASMKVGGVAWKKASLTHAELVKAGAIDVALAVTGTTWAN